MKIGFIGAGKVGFTLGKHFTEFARNGGTAFSTEEKDLPISNEIFVAGYYSQSEKSAREAARFTDTTCYESMKQLVQACDTIFLTVPDDCLSVITEELDASGEDLEGKLIIHTSGALSSQVFSGMGSRIYGYSVHPIYAVNSKTASYINFHECFITIEGGDMYARFLMDFFAALGHPVKRIRAEDKTLYHAAAVFASNLVVGLYDMGSSLLSSCGFSKAEAEQALVPLFLNNAKNIAEVGAGDALTGPVARGDEQTVRKHLQVLREREQREHDGVLDTYRLLSGQLLCLLDGGHEDMKKLLEE